MYSALRWAAAAAPRFTSHTAERVRQPAREQPQRVRVAAAHVLGVERAVADAVVAQQGRPVLGFAPAVVAQRDLGAQQDDTAGPVGAVGEVVVLRRPQRPAAAEHLVEPADRVEQPAPGGEVGAHAEHLEPVLAAQPSGFGDVERRRQRRIRRRRSSGHDLPVQEVAVGLGRERAAMLSDPVGRHDAVVVGEGDDRRPSCGRCRCCTPATARPRRCGCSAAGDRRRRWSRTPPRSRRWCSGR